MLFFGTTKFNCLIITILDLSRFCVCHHNIKMFLEFESTPLRKHDPLKNTFSRKRKFFVIDELLHLEYAQNRQSSR